LVAGAVTVADMWGKLLHEDGILTDDTRFDNEDCGCVLGNGGDNISASPSG
jgi:hypothetical protein